MWFVSYMVKVKGTWEPRNRTMKSTHPLEWAAKHPEVKVIWWKGLSLGEKMAADQAQAIRRARRRRVS